MRCERQRDEDRDWGHRDSEKSRGAHALAPRSRIVRGAVQSNPQLAQLLAKLCRLHLLCSTFHVTHSK